MAAAILSIRIDNPNAFQAVLWNVENGSGTTTPEKSVRVDWSDEGNEGAISILVIDQSGCRATEKLLVELVPPVAVEDVLQSVNIYPNPASSYVIISSVRQEVLFVRVLDILGNEIGNLMLFGGEQQMVSTNLLPAGLYLFEISDGSQKLTKRIIKR